MMTIVSVLIFSIPLAGWGAYQLGEALITKIKVRKGHFKAYFRQKNHRKTEKLVKPEGDHIRVHGDLYPFSDSNGYIYYEGDTPTIEYNEHGEQINFLNEKSNTMDATDLNALAKRTYNLGKSHGAKNENLILLGVMAAAGVSIFNTLMIWGILDKI